MRESRLQKSFLNAIFAILSEFRVSEPFAPYEIKAPDAMASLFVKTYVSDFL